MRPTAIILTLILLLALCGCGEKKIADQPRQRAPRSSSDYLKKVAGPDLDGIRAANPDSQVQVRSVAREGKHWLVDLSVRSPDGRKTRKKVLVDRRGRVLEERTA